MVNIQDVAERAGVSTATVSRVINNSGYVGEKTRRKVLEAISELGYSPNSAARSLRTKSTLIVALMIPDITNPFFPELVRGVDDTLTKAGYRLLLCNSDGDSKKEADILRALAEQRVDGLIFTPTQTNESTWEIIQRQTYPVVLLDRVTESLALDCVATDHYSGALKATKHLISLGHKRIAHISGPKDVRPSQERINGYCAALIQAGIPVDETLILTYDFTREAGRSAYNDLKALDKPPTAVFAANDLQAIGLIEQALKDGIDIPTELSVCGFDDIEYSTIVSPPLTTISQPKYELGAVAAELLLRRISNPEAEIRRIKLEPQLVKRGTTAKRKRPKSVGEYRSISEGKEVPGEAVQEG